MKSSIMFLLMILTGFVSQTQTISLPINISEDSIVQLIRDSKKNISWTTESENDRFLGYKKVVSISPKGNDITSIVFISDVIKDKKRCEKTEVVQATINGEAIEFISEVQAPYTVVVKTRQNYPKLESEMTRILQGLPEAIKAEATKKDDKKKK